LTVSPGDIAGLVEAIRYLKEHPTERRAMGERGRAAAVKNHDRALIANQFGRFLQEQYVNRSKTH
jgi:glycosyltransferase involved in cell wall biosynthesis